MGEVGLPAFVGLLGRKADVGGFGALVRLRGDVAGLAEVPADRCRRQRQLMVDLQVPGDGVRVVVEPHLCVAGRALSERGGEYWVSSWW